MTQWNGRWGLLEQRIPTSFTVPDDIGPQAYFLDPAFGPSEIFLPTPAKGRYVFVAHSGISGSIAIRTAVGGLIVTIAVGEAVLLVCSSSVWSFVAHSAVSTGLVTEPRVITAAGAVVVAAGDRAIAMNKTVGAPTTVNLPAVNTRNYLELTVFDWKGDASTNNITIVPNGSEKIMNRPQWVLGADFAAISLKPSLTLGGWYIS